MSSTTNAPPAATKEPTAPTSPPAATNQNQQPAPAAAPPTQPAAISAMALPTKRTPPRRELSRLPILLYGRPKIGKSSFAAGAPNALFLPTEPGLNHLEVFQLPQDGSGIKTWNQFKAACGLIAAGGHQFETVVVDTVDVLADLCVKDFLLNHSGLESPGDLDYGKGWSLLSAEFSKVVRGLLQLPYGVIFISHAQQEHRDEKDKTPARWIPSMQGTARKVITKLVDFILFADIEQAKDPDSGAVTYRRVLRTKPTTLWEAGYRPKIVLPDTIDLDYKALAAAYAAAPERKI